ncbi:MAG: hypothetical protein HY074_18275 [Deltaproteobacteria bacterium]|nr:hypothetical protein [Deltaproteobacteria bacterium]
MNLLTTFLLFVSVCSIAPVFAGELPAQVILKSPTQTFTSRLEFALRDGRIWFKAMGASVASWSLFGGTGLPPFSEATFIQEISADGDTLVAVNEAGRVFDAELSHDKTGALQIHWNDAWGWPFRLAAKKLYLPQARRGWASSILNLKDGTYYEDPAGNPHLILGISTLYVLSADGRSIRFDDPWLPPNNFEFHVAGPDRGALPMVAISSSGSTVFVIDRTGRMFTRLVDFDTLGGNPGIAYSFTVGNRNYKTEGCWATLRTRLPFLFDVRKLPGDTWHEQPRINGQITKNITILQTGKGNAARELRVEGLDARGVSGYYSKPIDVRAPWTFKAGTEKMKGELLDANIGSESAQALGETHAGSAEFFQVGTGLVPTYAYAARLAGFNTYFEPATLSLKVAGSRLDLVLHLKADIFPMGETGRVDGVLIVGDAAHNARNSWVQELLQDYLLHRRAYPVKVSYGAREIRIEGNVLRSSSKNSFVIRFPRK